MSLYISLKVTREDGLFISYRSDKSTIVNLLSFKTSIKHFTKFKFYCVSVLITTFKPFSNFTMSKTLFYLFINYKIIIIKH